VLPQKTKKPRTFQYHGFGQLLLRSLLNRKPNSSRFTVKVKVIKAKAVKVFNLHQ